LEIVEEHGSLSTYLWRFVGGKPKINNWRSITEIPTRTVEAELMSKALKKKGFSFVGT